MYIVKNLVGHQSRRAENNIVIYDTFWQEWRRCIVSVLQSTYNRLKVVDSNGTKSQEGGASSDFDYKGELCRYRIGNDSIQQLYNIVGICRS